MIHPLVTVTVFSYNQADYICDAIESVINQTYSNLEIIQAVEKNTPLKVDYDTGPRRDGDPASLIADVSETRYLGWKPKHNLDSIITTAYGWYTR